MDKNAATAATEAQQLELAPELPDAAEAAQADVLVELGLETQKADSQPAAEPAALGIPVQPSHLEGHIGTMMQVVKEETLGASPAWKLRAAREAAQHTGATLYADVCGPGLILTSTTLCQSKPYTPWG